jgi:hypothetical protein
MYSKETPRALCFHDAFSLAGVFLAGVFLAGVFLAGVFLAGIFLARFYVTVSLYYSTIFLSLLDLNRSSHVSHLASRLASRDDDAVMALTFSGRKVLLLLCGGRQGSNSVYCNHTGILPKRSILLAPVAVETPP